MTLLALVMAGCIGCSAFNSDSQALADSGRTYEDRVVVDGETRTFLVHEPDRLAEPAPLILSFHGKWGQGQDQLRLTGMNEIAGRNGFIVVYPDGKNREWDAGIRQGIMKRRLGDDLAFVRAIIQKLSGEYRIDPKRIYATGMSNGASFSHRLACEMADTFAAIAAVAGTIAPSVDATCRPARPIAVMQVSGTDDPIVPYEGNRILMSVEATVSGWAERNGCTREPMKQQVASDIEAMVYDACRGNAVVALYRVQGGGHTWPGGWQYAPVSVVGKTATSMNASERIWAFFKDHPMP